MKRISFKHDHQNKKKMNHNKNDCDTNMNNNNNNNKNNHRHKDYMDFTGSAAIFPATAIQYQNNNDNNNDDNNRNNNAQSSPCRAIENYRAKDLYKQFVNMKSSDRRSVKIDLCPSVADHKNAMSVFKDVTRLCGFGHVYTVNENMWIVHELSIGNKKYKYIVVEFLFSLRVKSC